MARKNAGPKVKYRLLTGFDYAGKRYEAGDVVDDFPADVAAVHVDQGLIEIVDAEVSK